MRRLPWGFKAYTAADWRAVGDDYLLPYNWDTVSISGLCRVAGHATNSPHHLFRPRISTRVVWWDDPATAAGREERAWACYFIAAMLDDEEIVPMSPVRPVREWPDGMLPEGKYGPVPFRTRRKRR